MDNFQDIQLRIAELESTYDEFIREKNYNYADYFIKVIEPYRVLILNLQGEDEKFFANQEIKIIQRMLKDLKHKILEWLIKIIRKELDKVKHTGKIDDVGEMIRACRDIGGPSLLMSELSIASNIFKITNTYSMFEKEYKNFISISKNKSLDQASKYNQLFNVMNGSEGNKSLKIYFENFTELYNELSEEEQMHWIEKKNDIQSHFNECEKILSRLMSGQSGISTLLESEQFREALQEIEQHIIDRSPTIFSYTSEDIQFNEKGEISPEEARRILLVRWRRYSAEKYAGYLDDVENQINNGNYNPLKLLEFLRKKREDRGLLSFSELGTELTSGDKFTKSKVNKWLLLEKKLDQESSPVRSVIFQLDIWKSTLEPIQDLFDLRNKLKDDADWRRFNFLEGDFQTAEERLIEKCIRQLEHDIKNLQTEIDVNPNYAKRRIEGILKDISEERFPSDFSAQRATLYQLLDLTIKTINYHREKSPSMLLEDLLIQCDELIQQYTALDISHESLKKERGSIESMIQPTESAEKLINEYSALKILNFSDVLSINYETLKSLLSRISDIISILNNPEQRDILQNREISQLDRLIKAKVILDACMAYQLARGELNLSGSNLKRVKDLLQEANRLCEEIPEFDSEPNQVEYDYRQFLNNDPKVEKAIREAENILIAKIEVIEKAIHSLIKAWDRLDDCVSKPNSYRERFDNIQSQLREKLEELLLPIFDDLIRSPKDFQRDSEPALQKWPQWINWYVHLHRDEELSRKLQQAFHEAYAWKYLEERKFKLCWQEWQEAYRISIGENSKESEDEQQRFSAHVWASRKLYALIDDQITFVEFNFIFEHYSSDSDMILCKVRKMLENEEALICQPGIKLDQLKEDQFTKMVSKLDPYMGIGEDEQFQSLPKNTTQDEYNERVWQLFYYDLYSSAQTKILDLYKKVDQRRRQFSQLKYIAIKLDPSKSCRLISFKNFVNNAMDLVKDLNDEDVVRKAWNNYKKNLLLQLEG